MLFRTQNNKYRSAIAGFTLFELLVTMSVFALLSTVMIANFRSADNSLILKNVAQQVALVVRKAQVQGISVKGLGSGPLEVFPSYGVNFNTSGAGIPPPNTGFVLFADLDPVGPPLPNNIFDGSCPGAECVQRYSLLKNYTIQAIYGNQKTNAPGPGTSLSRLDVTFTRPNPEATFVTVPSAAPPGGYSDVEVVLQSKAGATKKIIIWRTGQISVE